jgi:hypothetical protein
MIRYFQSFYPNNLLYQPILVLLLYDLISFQGIDGLSSLVTYFTNGSVFLLNLFQRMIHMYIIDMANLEIIIMTGYSHLIAIYQCLCYTWVIKVNLNLYPIKSCEIFYK